MYSWLAFSAPLADSQAVRRWIRESQALYALDNGVRAAVVDEDSNRLLGCVELRIDADGVATAGYWTVHAERGRGIARGALKIIVDWAFANDLVWAVDLLTLPGNTASEHVALACGFRRDGVHTTYDRRLGHEVTFNAFTLSNSAAIIAEPSSPEDSTTNL
jgi:RimJ/RimL family protein N-acetyltransferase